MLSMQSKSAGHSTRLVPSHENFKNVPFPPAPFCPLSSYASGGIERRALCNIPSRNPSGTRRKCSLRNAADGCCTGAEALLSISGCCGLPPRLGVADHIFRWSVCRVRFLSSMAKMLVYLFARVDALGFGHETSAWRSSKLGAI